MVIVTVMVPVELLAVGDRPRTNMASLGMQSIVHIESMKLYEWKSTFVVRVT